MEKINATSHAKNRMQQRAVKEIQIRLIEYFGEFAYQKGGSYCAHLPAKTITQLRQALDKIAKVNAIYGDSDKLVTVMHETRKTHKTKFIA